MTLRARIDPGTDAWLFDRVRVMVDRPEDRAVFAQRIEADGTTSDEWWLIDHDPAVEHRRPVVLDVPEFIAHAVYEALRERFEPELADVRRLDRRDLEVERARVDRLLDVVSRLALDGVE